MTTTVLGISTGAVKRLFHDEAAAPTRPPHPIQSARPGGHSASLQALPRPGLTPHPPATAPSSAAACAQHGWPGDIGGRDVVAGEPDMAAGQRRRTGQRGDTGRYRRGAPGGPVVVGKRNHPADPDVGRRQRGDMARSVDARTNGTCRRAQRFRLRRGIPAPG